MYNTLKGPITPSELGVTLMHEHIFVMNPELVVNYPESFDHKEMVEKAVKKFRELKAGGVDTLVDLTVMGQGRDVRLLEPIAQRVELNIIVATGWYTFSEAPVFATLRGPGRIFGGLDPLTEIFVRDIEEGISTTRIKASVLKCAADVNGITDGIKIIMNSVAEAHLQTKAPIMTHSDPSTRNGINQQDFFENRGVPLENIVIGHSGDSTDIDYLRSLADRGSTLGMDRFGLESRQRYTERINTVAEMCRLGYADRMVISTDSSVYSMNFREEDKAKHLPAWDSSLIMESVIRDLKVKGVTDEQVDQMLVHNPRRILARD